MKRTLMLLVVALLVMASIPALAARKECSELKQEIAAKIDAKGVKQYTLDIVANGTDAEGKVVGTCDGGTQRIVYQRVDAAPTSAVAKAD
jgi:hypothetical protein